MTKEEFKAVYIEAGLTMSGTTDFIDRVVGKLYDARQESKHYSEVIDLMNTVARHSALEVKCRCCKQYYEIRCELSEFDPDMSYCGKDQYCTP